MRSMNVIIINQKALTREQYEIKKYLNIKTKGKKEYNVNNARWHSDK